MSTAHAKKGRIVQRYYGLAPASVLLALFAIGFVVTLQFPEVLNYLGCSRENLLKLRLHTLVTYILYPLGLEHVIRITVSLFLSVYFIGDLLTQPRIWTLIAGSTVLGAVLFCAIVEPPAIFVGGVMIAWGLAGAVIALGLVHWRKLGILRRTYFILISLFTLFLMFSFTALAYAQLLMAAAAFTTIHIWRRSDHTAAGTVPTQPCAAPNGGPATSVGSSDVTEGPPSVSLDVSPTLQKMSKTAANYG